MCRRDRSGGAFDVPSYVVVPSKITAKKNIAARHNICSSILQKTYTAQSGLLDGSKSVQEIFHPVFTCSKSTMETPEQCMESVHR